MSQKKRIGISRIISISWLVLLMFHSSGYTQTRTDLHNIFAVVTAENRFSGMIGYETNYVELYFREQGRVEEFTLKSKIYNYPRRVWIYTPPGYSKTNSETYDLLVVFDGWEYLNEIPLPTMLDSLIAAKKIPPTVALLIDDSSAAVRLNDLANREEFVGFVGDELIPWVRQKWKVTHDPHHTIITGSSAGGLAATFLALRRPDLFGKVLSQSGAFWRGAEGSNSAPYEWLTKEYSDKPGSDIRFFLDVGARETRGALQGAAPSILEANRHLRDVLLKKGYPVIYFEVPDGAHAPEFWRLRLPIGLVSLAGAMTT